MASKGQIHFLRCLLHYHERMTMGANNCPESPCIKAAVQDEYAEALREAIRCMEIVHGARSVSAGVE